MIVLVLYISVFQLMDSIVFIRQNPQKILLHTPIFKCLNKTYLKVFSLGLLESVKMHD